MRKSSWTLSSFFSNKSNRTLTFCCSLFAACACTFPFANSYWEARAERLDASSKAQDLQDLKDRVVLLTDKRTETSETVAQLRELVVEEEDIEAFRNEIVEIVRTADCRLRNVSLAERYERPWKEDDNVLSDGNDLDPDDLDAVTGYSLQTQKLALNVSGEFENIQKVIKAIQRIDKFLYTVKLDLESDSNQEIALQWELAIVGLVYTPPEIFDDEDW